MNRYKKCIIVVVLALLSGCYGGSIYSERLEKAIEFCADYGGIYQLRIDSIADSGDRVDCFNQRKTSFIDRIK